MPVLCFECVWKVTSLNRQLFDNRLQMQIPSLGLLTFQVCEFLYKVSADHKTHITLSLCTLSPKLVISFVPKMLPFNRSLHEIED